MTQTNHSCGGLSRTLCRRQFLAIAGGLFIGAVSLPAFADEVETLAEELASSLQPQKADSLPPDAAHRVLGHDRVCLPVSRPLFLTFDDGPLACTGRILDLLAKANQQATFFVVGRNLVNPKMRDLAIRALKEGHDLGNHSFTHPNFSAISARRAEQEIVGTHVIIEDLLKEANTAPNRQNRFFRFPYGVAGSASSYMTCRRVLAELGYRTVGWDLDTSDWRMELGWFRRSSFAVVASLNKARPLDVVLLHDRVRTSEHLPEMLRVLGHQRLGSLPLSDYEQSVAVLGRKESDEELDLVSPSRSVNARGWPPWSTGNHSPRKRVYDNSSGPAQPGLLASRHPLGTDKS